MRNRIQSRLARLTNSIFILTFLKEFGLIFYISALWLFAFAIVDNILHLNLIFRWINLLSFLTLLSVYIKKSFNKLIYIRPEYVAIEIENRYKFNDQIISALQLENSNEYPEYFITHLKEQASQLINRVKLINIFRFKTLYNRMFKALFFLFLIILYGSFFNNNFKVSLNRFINPNYRIKQIHKIIKMDISPKNATGNRRKKC